MRASRSAAALKPERAGVLAVVQEQQTADRLQGICRDMQLDDELVITDTVDSALRRIRSGYNPRVLLLDLVDSAAPIAEVSSARTVGGAELKIVALGALNDVALFRDLLAAGANDYLVNPPTREALSAALEKRSNAPGMAADGLGQVIVFTGSRGGVGTTTTAVSCAWLIAEERSERGARLDLDLHFGTIALKLDTDPGSGLCEALEQPSRVDSLFIDRAMVKVTENLRVLAAEASATQHMIIDAGAIDVLLYELRRKFSKIVVDLPRGATPIQRVVLAAATHVVIVCERSLAGLRDTIRWQTMMREQAPQVRLWLVEAGATAGRALLGKSDFEKGIAKSLDFSISYDAKSAGAAANSGQPLPVAVPRSPIVREFRQLAEVLAGPALPVAKRKLFALSW